MGGEMGKGASELLERGLVVCIFDTVRAKVYFWAGKFGAGAI